VQFGRLEGLLLSRLGFFTSTTLDSHNTKQSAEQEKYGFSVCRENAAKLYGLDNIIPVDAREEEHPSPTARSPVP
jgi:hypothetical protein